MVSGSGEAIVRKVRVAAISAKAIGTSITTKPAKMKKRFLAMLDVALPERSPFDLVVGRGVVAVFFLDEDLPVPSGKAEGHLLQQPVGGSQRHGREPDEQRNGEEPAESTMTGSATVMRRISS